MSFRKLWLGLFVVVAASFAVLGYYGSEIYRQAPPLPAPRGDQRGASNFYRRSNQGWPKRLAVARWQEVGHGLGAWQLRGP